MRTLLITGGAGFIGSNFIYYELEHGSDIRIVCLDKLTYAGHLETLRDALWDERVTFVRGDIADEETVRRVFREEKPDTVVNFAAESHVDRSISDPGLFLRTNVLGAQVLMDACRDFGAERFHQVSTDEVYGDLPLESEELFTEDCPLKASSPYSASKAAADLLVGAYSRTYGLKASISRCSNNYGPYQYPEKLIPVLLTNAAAGRPLPVYGNGRNVRDWLYVEDHCAAIDLILRRGKAGSLYNIGGGCRVSNTDVARRVCALTGADESLITFVADRRGHDLRYAMDYSLLESELGWAPSVGFDEGLKLTAEWYSDNADWCAAVKAEGERT